MSLPALLPSRRERPSDATRRRVFEAALDEFRQVGFDHSGVARICRRAGVSRPTFYSHFPTKEHVLRELMFALELGIAERLKRCRSLREALQALVDGLLEAEARVEDPDLLRTMLSLSARRSPAEAIEEGAFATLVELGRHFEEGAERGELRPGIDPRRAPILCLASVYGVQVAVTAEERHADFEQLFSLYLTEDPR